MAENPATWNRAEQIIDKALEDHEEGQRQGMIGLTRVKAIANALRAAGYDLNDPA